MIAGSYGIGKTRLLQAVLAEARARHFLIAHGTASQTDADVPYSVFVDAFTPVVLGLAAEDDLTTLIEDLARARQRLGEYGAARSLWLRARESHLNSGNQVALARVERRMGTLTMLTGAHDVFQRLGAQLELRLTREQMRELGLRPQYRTTVTGGVLTLREREVAILAAEGLGNKEIGAALSISWRTVSTHLAAVYGKLGVDSRAGLGEVVRRMSDK